MTLINEIDGRIEGPYIGTGSGKPVKFWGLGSPTSGTTSATGYGFAGKGSEYTDTNAGKLYINTGTGPAYITWTLVGAQT